MVPPIASEKIKSKIGDFKLIAYLNGLINSWNKWHNSH
jgi:hypothetical protein